MGGSIAGFFAVAHGQNRGHRTVVAIEHDIAAIAERNEPFAISGHSQREVVGKLAWKSAACIWGGPVLTLVCLYFLMVYFHWNF
jgi:hypothetical protein